MKPKDEQRRPPHPSGVQADALCSLGDAAGIVDDPPSQAGHSPEEAESVGIGVDHVDDNRHARHAVDFRPEHEVTIDRVVRDEGALSQRNAEPFTILRNCTQLRGRAPELKTIFVDETIEQFLARGIANDTNSRCVWHAKSPFFDVNI